MYRHSPRCRHSALFYREDETLRDSVRTYIASALRAGEPALVIAKPALRQHLTIELHRQHVQGEPFGPERGPLVTLDAEATLERLCVDGKPDDRLFRKVIGDALKNVATEGKRVAAYGEMVGVLCERGRYADAIRLEGMWNELLAEADVSLHCGYALRLFDFADARPYLDQIRAAHTDVSEPAGS